MLSMNRLGVRLASLAAVVALVIGLLFRMALAGGLTHSFLSSFNHPFGGLPLVRYDDGATIMWALNITQVPAEVIRINQQSDRWAVQ